MAEASTLRAQLAQARLPRLEAQMLWQHVLDRPRAWLIAHDTDPLPPEQLARFAALQQRRLDGEPMAYLLGRREFMGHEFLVSPAVLIPRPETELLVDAALQAVRRLRAAARSAERRGAGLDHAAKTAAAGCPDAAGAHAAPAAGVGVEADGGRLSLLDLGTGSGAVAVSLALADAALDVTATDISEAALALAQQNALRLGASVEFHQGNWYDALSVRKQYAIIVSNPPYIADGDPHLSQGDLRHEPAQALTDGADGLQALRAIVAGARDWLLPGGELWLEHGWDQAHAVRECLCAAGFQQVRSLDDLAGIARVSGGQRTFFQQE